MVRKGSTVKKSASRKSLKKSSSRSHSHASHHATNSSGFKMFAHCPGCGCKVNINNCKYVMIKDKGSKMRTRIEGVCEKGHKVERFAKSSGGKSSSKTMKGGSSGLVISVGQEPKILLREGEYFTIVKGTVKIFPGNYKVDSIMVNDNNVPNRISLDKGEGQSHPRIQTYSIKTLDDCTLTKE